MMIEYIILIAIGLIVMMAKKRGGRSMARYNRGNVSEVLGLGTLAPDTVIATVFDNVVDDRTRITSVVATYALQDHIAGEGPLVFGIAHGGYTVAEIQEWFDEAGSWNESDLIGNEVGARMIRTVGSFDGQTTSEKFNNGRPVKTKLNWILNEGATLALWCVNRDDNALTSATALVADGHANMFYL